jgi:hypothetical protein
MGIRPRARVGAGPISVGCAVVLVLPVALIVAMSALATRFV